MKTVYYTATSLDGFIADPEHSLDWLLQFEMTDDYPEFGGELAASFHDQGLLDELIITVAPVTLGAGAPLLPRRIASPPLRLVSATRRGSAFVQLRYEVKRTD